ncbi:MAG TPA: GspH/FimT family pseudopilin [Gemmatimonadales bacterium]|nr:GspH/FimT family pseudopilin [Gemmatimonadales bacterium]
MRRGVTLLELALVLVLVGLLAGVVMPRFQRVADSLAVHHAALELVSAHRRARISAILQSRILELTISADSLAIRIPGAPGDLWHAAGPAAQGVSLSGPVRTLVFSPVGLTMGLSNASFHLSRGVATRTVIVSRLGRLRVTP